MPSPDRRPILRFLFVATGTVCVVLGLVGLFLPLLPTTPFLLLAAACFARGSERAYGLLLSNRWTGPIITQWRDQRTIPQRAKWTAIVLVFIAFSLSVLFLPNCVYGYVLLFVVGAGLIVFLASLETRPRESSSTSESEAVDAS